MATQKTYLNWNNDSIIWGNNDYIWSEVFIVVQVGGSFGGGGGGIVLSNKQPWKDLEKQLDDKKFTPEDKKLFLQVVAKVNGLVNSEVKTVNEKTKKLITVDHIKKTFSTFGQKVEVTVKNIKKQ